MGGELTFRSGPSFARVRYIPYFLEISLWRDLISGRCTLQRNLKGGEISRATTSPLTHLVPAHSSISIVRIVRVRLHSVYLEFDDPFPCGEISRKYGNIKEVYNTNLYSVSDYSSELFITCALAWC